VCDVPLAYNGCGLFSLVQITETRRALRDSESGLEKMAIGHHIQDRGHVVEKKHNKKTGEKELNQDFQNMDECKFRGK
jgi:myeloid leukemia factor 1